MKKIGFLLASLALISCTNFNPTLMEITPTDKEVVDVRKECENHYKKNDQQVVAVVEFANRTTYTDSKVSSGRSNRVSAAGIAYYDDFAIALGASGSNFEYITKEIHPQFGEYAQNAIESWLVSRANVGVVSRSHMNSILKEQQFQMLIADPYTAVEMGRLTGARYIVTGSVDNLDVVYKETSNMAKDNEGVFGFILSVFDIYSNMDSGWNITTELTINLIDVSTGKIISTSKAKGYANVGDSPYFTSDQIVSGSKKAMGEAIEASIEYLIEHFEAKGYINEMRGERKAALINIGKNNGVKKGDLIKAYETSIISDFKTGAKECKLTPLPIKMVVSEFVDADSSWVEVNTSDPYLLSKLKIGTIVKKSAR